MRSCCLLLPLVTSLLINCHTHAAHPMDAVYAEFEIEGGQKVAANWYHLYEVVFQIRWNPTARKVIVRTGKGWISTDKLSDEHRANIDAACVAAGLGKDAETVAKKTGFGWPQDVRAEVLKSDLGSIPTCRLTNASYDEMLRVLAKVQENYQKNQPHREQMAALAAAEQASRDAEWAARNAEWAARNAEQAARNVEWQLQLINEGIFMNLY